MPFEFESSFPTRQWNMMLLDDSNHGTQAEIIGDITWSRFFH